MIYIEFDRPPSDRAPTGSRGFARRGRPRELLLWRSRSPLAAESGHGRRATIVSESGPALALATRNREKRREESEWTTTIMIMINFWWSPLTRCVSALDLVGEERGKRVLGSYSVVYTSTYRPVARGRTTETQLSQDHLTCSEARRLWCCSARRV